MSDVQVLQGDALAVLKTLPAESVNCVVTSPPYFGLRAYSGGLAEIGIEADPESYVGRLVAIFREVRRVLRKDGTVWLNLGDSYAAGGSGGSSTSSTLSGYTSPTVKQATMQQGTVSEKPSLGLKPKDIVGIPWMVAFALRADGWYLRQDIIWHKIAPMPESVTDRCTKSHEYVFLLAKSRQYFFDAVAIQEPHKREWWHETVGPGYMTAEQGRNDGGKRQGSGDPSGANKRDVWTLGPEQYGGAHFAVMPSKLVEPCILAGTSEYGCCSECGAPWRRQTETSRTFESGSGRSGNLPSGKNGPALQGGGETRDIRRGPVVSTSTTGWEPTCKHPTAPVIPAVVLDPFAGSGTVGKVALKHRRHAVLIELNADYCRLIEKRLHGVQVTLPFEEASA